MKRKEKNLKLVAGMWRVNYNVVIGRETDEKTGKSRNLYKRVRESFIDRDDALEVLEKVGAKRRATRQMRNLGVAVPTVDKGLVTFEEFAKRIIAARFAKNGRQKTEDSHQTCLRNLLKSTHFMGCRLLDITTEKVDDYMKERTVDHPISANRELSFLKLVLNAAVNRREMATDPSRPVSKCREPETKIRVLADPEARALIDAADDKLKPILEVLLVTGLRKTEALSAVWEYSGWESDPTLKNAVVSLKRKVIHVPDSVAKSHKSREIPMGRGLVELFKRMKATDADAVFGLTDITRPFRRAATKAGINGLRTHHLRHTAASRMIEAKADVVTVCRLLGHASLAVTLRYCHTDAEKGREAVELLSDVYLSGPTGAVTLPMPVQSGQKIDITLEKRPVRDLKHYL